jgi:hypothetical protein
VHDLAFDVDWAILHGVVSWFVLALQVEISADSRSVLCVIEV